MSISTSASSGVKDQLTSQAMPEINHALGSQIPSQLFEQAHADRMQPIASDSSLPNSDRTTFKCVKPWTPVQGHSFNRYMRLQSVTQDSLIDAIGITGFEDGKIALTLSVHKSRKEKFENSFCLNTDEASLQDGVYVYAVHQESEIQNILKQCDFPLEQRAFLKRLIVTQNWKTARLKKKIPCTDVIHRLRRLHLFCNNHEEAEKYLTAQAEGYVFYPSSKGDIVLGLLKWQGSPFIDLKYRIDPGGALLGTWHHAKTPIIESDSHRTMNKMLSTFKKRIVENNLRRTNIINQMTLRGLFCDTNQEAEQFLMEKSHGYVMRPSSQGDRFITVLLKKRDASISNYRFSFEPDGRFKLNDREYFSDLDDLLKLFESFSTT